MTAGVPTEFIPPDPQNFETPPIIHGVDWFTKPVLVAALALLSSGVLIAHAAIGTSGVNPRSVDARVMLMWQVVHSITCSPLPPSCANFAEMRLGDVSGANAVAANL